jgi:hypothetical protein
MRALIFLLAAVICRAQDYFPEAAFSERKDLHRLASSWYSSQLKALDEPPLFARRSYKNVECYRFTWLRTFHRPVVLRVDIKQSGDATFTIKVASGKGGYEPGKLVREVRKPLAEPALTKLRSTVLDAKFFSLPTAGGDEGLDGSRWIVEVVRGGRYHVVSRWTPQDGPVHQIGSQLIELATGDDLVPVY